MAKEDILAKIKSEFEKEAELIRQDAEEKIQTLIKENEKKISSHRSEIFNGLHNRLEEVRRKSHIETDIKIRNLLLTEKQNIINKILQDVQNEIKDNEKEYRGLIEKTIVSFVSEEEGEIVFSKEDKFNEDFVKEINNRIKSLGNRGILKLSKEYGTFKGGFIIRYKELEVNNTLETIFAHLRQELDLEVGKILFQT